MNNYNWFENHEGELGFTVRHTEGDVETLIAVTDTAEKAHLITTMLNNQGPEELIPTDELLKPYRKQSRNGVLDWVSYEDAVKVLKHQQVQFHLLKQIYDDAILQWKDADKQIGLKELSNAALLLENRDIKNALIKLFPGAFLWWVHEQGWHKHSSGEYYYKSKDFHQWPPDESITIEDLKVQFKAAYKL